MQKHGDYEFEEFVCAEHDLHPCRGCLACWSTVDGHCVQNDDMQQLFRSYVQADIVAWAFPNYFYGLPSTVKMVLERLLPIEYPMLAETNPSHTKHKRRYDLEHQRYLTFVTCGLFNRDGNINGIQAVFSQYYGAQCEQIYCTEEDRFDETRIRWVR